MGTRIVTRPIRRKYERVVVQDSIIQKRVNKEVVPKPRINRQYDFLKYTRIVFKWATVNYEISRPHLELLLYLYGEGLFTKYEYNDAHRIIGMKEAYSFKKFTDEGWIVVFQERKGKSKRLYSLSDKGKKMCNRMHRIMIGEEKIPETKRYNKLAQQDDITSKFYMKAISKMNRRRSKEEED